jgi:hypothetical protein
MVIFNAKPRHANNLYIMNGENDMTSDLEILILVFRINLICHRIKYRVIISHEDKDEDKASLSGKIKTRGSSLVL